MTTLWAITASVLMHAATIAAAETMALDVDDMRDPASNTLAARHDKNRYI